MGVLTRVAVLVVVLAVAGWTLSRSVGSVDGDGFRAALRAVEAWQLVVLAGALCVRQVLNAAPLAFFVPGIGLPRATAADQAAVVVNLVAPPPADVAIRVAMFTSWGASVSLTTAAALINTLIFYVVRFAAPAVGLVVAASVGEYDATYLLPTVASAAISSGLVAVLVLLGRGEQVAVRLGRTAGRVARRVRRSVDPDAWGAAVSSSHADLVERMPVAVSPSLLALTAMVLWDGAMLLFALRCVGLSADEVPAGVLLAAFLLAYPLTFFPFHGLGVLDAVVIAFVTAHAGESVEDGLLAALAVWRLVVTPGPLLLGVASLGWWRWSRRRRARR